MKSSHVWLAAAMISVLGLAGCVSDKQPETIDVASRIAQARAQYSNPAVSAGPAPTAAPAASEPAPLTQKSYIK